MRRRSAVLACALLLVQSACAAWQPMPLRAAAPGFWMPQQVRITLADSSRAVLRQPRTSPDSIFGMTPPGRGDGKRWQPAAFALDQVVRIERYDEDAARANSQLFMGAVSILGLYCLLGWAWVSSIE
jgi:hypothetical protein